uniref:Uncharacterized protein n=1 Tax=Vespula pensylvanica TaxID=30213 RepID=A0A834J0M2_VESPE|nr:hypothetical protein H0235_018487 [Vespula pensylvanica]
MHISILAVRILRKTKRCGGDTVPLGGNIRPPPLTMGPVMSRISTIHISILANETEWWGCSATWGEYKRAALGSGFIHATKFHHAHLNPRGTHAPKDAIGANFHFALSKAVDSLSPWGTQKFP